MLIPFSIGNSDLSIQNWLPVELKTSVVQEPDSGWESSGNHYGDVVDVNDPVWNVKGETDSPAKLPDDADFVVQAVFVKRIAALHDTNVPSFTRLGGKRMGRP